MLTAFPLRKWIRVEWFLSLGPPTILSMVVDGTRVLDGVTLTSVAAGNAPKLVVGATYSSPTSTTRLSVDDVLVDF